MNQNARILRFFLLLAIAAATPSAHAAKLTVNCDKHEPIRTALHLLATTNPQGPNTITVLGSCKGNIVVQSMDRLTLITNSGASITDRSSGALPVVDIEDSRSVTVKGFTINGGAGITCGSSSVCYMTGNTIQGGGIGILGGSRAFLASNVIQNGDRGSTVSDGSQLFSSNDIFQSNGQGLLAFAAYVEASNSSFLNNGVGILASATNLRLLGGTTISGIGGDGLSLRAGSISVFQGVTITGNGGDGVHLEDASFAGFQAATVTGNLSGLDVDCGPQFTITHFVARTGGVTNCAEPAAAAKRKAVE